MIATMTPRVLTNDDLRRIAPSVFATQPFHAVSGSYRFLPTAGVLDILRDRGYHPVMAMQSTTRLPDKRPFTKHLLRLRHSDHLIPQPVGAELPELIICNSHDKSSAFRFAAGIWRLVCSNGLLVASADFGAISVKHSGSRDLEERVIDATFKIVEDTPRVFDQIQAWKQISLTPPQQLAFASAALEIRDGNSAIDPASIISARRAEDKPEPDGNRDLWRTMNVCQESLTKGGVRGHSQSGRRITTRPIKAVDADLRTNRALWRLAEEMAKLT